MNKIVTAVAALITIMMFTVSVHAESGTGLRTLKGSKAPEQKTDVTADTSVPKNKSVYMTIEEYVRARGQGTANGIKDNVKLLTYHLISEDAALHSAYCISPEMFENDVKYLKENGYTFMTVSQLPVSDTSQGKIAVITFDDGYSSDYKYVVPILEKYDAKATFFIVGSYVDTPGYLTTEEFKEMSTKSCVELGNHSYKIHDYSYRDLSEMYKNPEMTQQILDDYAKNDEFFVEKLGWAPISLSYPYGLYSISIDSELRARGKMITVSTEEKPYNHESTAPTGRKNRDVFREIDDIVN